MTPAPTTADAPGDLAEHAAILVEGDADLCNETNAEGIDVGDGIVNCATADGTPERPYRIEGWRILLDPPPPCNVASPLPGVAPACPLPPPCPGQELASVVALCGVTKHVVLSRLDIESHARDADVPALLIMASDHVHMEDVEVRSPVRGVHIQGGAEAAPEDPVRLTRVASRPLPVDDGLVSVPNIASPALAVLDASVVVEGSTFDAGSRQFGIRVDASVAAALGARHSFVLQDSFVSNATLSGVHVRQATVLISNNLFSNNGPAGTEVHSGGSDSVSTGGAQIFLESLEFEVVGNTFDFAAPVGAGVMVETTAPGRVDLNRFQGGGVHTMALHVEAFYGCAVRAWFNEFGTHQVVNEESSCFVDVRFNWWDDASGPNLDSSPLSQVYGRLLFTPWLQAPLDDLPWARVEEPAPGAQVHGDIVLRGAAGSPTSAAVERVEASLAPDAWEAPAVADGTTLWTLALNISRDALGPFSVWVRACTSDTCGVPTQLDLEAVEAPLPPVALLDVQPRTAQPGESVTLDASRSYAPQGRAILLYRFDLGDGGVVAWSPLPIVEHAYAEEGSYVVSLQVQDAEGLRNTNPAQALVRVRDANRASLRDLDQGNLPGPAIGLILLAVAATAWTWRRQRQP